MTVAVPPCAAATAATIGNPRPAPPRVRAGSAFILARIREEYDRTGSTRAAVAEGIGRTGRLVTSGALILFLSFASLAAAPGTELKVFAIGLGLGVLLDATIIRALLVPALVAILGRWNWWLPHWAANLLRRS